MTGDEFFRPSCANCGKITAVIVPKGTWVICDNCQSFCMVKNPQAPRNEVLY